MDKKKIIALICFLITYLLLSAIMIFYIDLANGPLYVLIVFIILFIICLILRIILRKKAFKFRLIVDLMVILSCSFVFIFAKTKIETFYPVDEISKTEILHLGNGDIVGTYNSDQSVEIYTGIPYAKAPVGELRFKEPQDVENWDGVLECTSFAPRAMQKDRASAMDSLIDIYAMGGWHPDFKMNPRQDMSEDCLYLNIWKPNTTSTNLPILVYIHGGSLMSGSSAFSDYNGENIAREGIIMITISYRLGVFGYFASEELINESPNHTTGNYGLLDQIKALEWINDNAIYFGGDKDNITIAGESAGSSSVSALCTSPLASGLFKRAIGESSSIVGKTPPHTFRTIESALEMGKEIMDEFGCATIEELRNIPADELIKTGYENSSMTLDGYALTKMPYEVYLAHENNEEALLNGYNVKESDAFVVPLFLLSPTNKGNIKERLETYFDKEAADAMCELYKDKIEKDAFAAFNEIISVYWFILPHHEWSTLALNNGEVVYRYQFTKENGYYGTYHSGELIYLYGNLIRSKHQFAYDESDYKLQDIMVKYLVNFVKTGNPNGSGLPIWNEYTLNGGVQELGTEVKEIDDEYLGLYPIIESFLERTSEGDN